MAVPNKQLLFNGRTNNGTGPDLCAFIPSSLPFRLTTHFAHRTLNVYLVHSQSPKGQWFACVVVNQEHLGVQDHTLTPRKSFRDVVLKVGHLEVKR